MNYDGQIQRASDLKLLPKYFALHVAWRMVIVIVEADFTPGADARTLLCQVNQSSFRRAVKQFRVVRMNADGAVNLRMLLSQFYCSLKCAPMRIAGAHVKLRRHSRVMRARNHLRSIGIIFRTVNVAMRINKHRSSAG